MEEIFDFLNGEEIEDIPTPDEEFVEWKKKKSEARARMVAMQKQPYEVKKRRSELRANEFVEQMDERELNAPGNTMKMNIIMRHHAKEFLCLRQMDPQRTDIYIVRFAGRKYMWRNSR